MLTKDKKNLEVAWYLAWQIDDVDRFLKSVRTVPDASARLEDLSASILAAELGGKDLSDLVKVGETTALGPLMDQVTRLAAQQAGSEYGIKLVDCRLRRLNYPEEVRSAVFEQIRSERRRVAATTRAEGESQARIIRSAADLERARTLADAEADATRTIGEGEAEATRVANAAHSKNPAFYEFLKTLETYRSALDRRTTLVLSADSPFLRLLTAGPAPARTRPALSSRHRRDGRSAMKKLAWLALAIGVFVYLATGFAVIQQDEEGVERRFGAVVARPSCPGLHWTLPWGLGRIDRVKTGQTRSVSVGAQSLQAAPLTRTPNPETDDFLTGDLNLATAQAIVQYHVTDPALYLFSATSADRALVLAAETSLTRALAEQGIDDVLTVGRAEIADRVRSMVQSEADSEKLGVSILAVRLGRVAPPVPVAPAFADAARARSDKRQVITSAEEYRDRLRSEARSQAQEITDRAQAQHDQALASARGEADRFLKVLSAATADLPATSQRLYLDMLTELLPRFQRKVVVAPGQDLDISLFADSESSNPDPAPTSAFLPEASPDDPPRPQGRGRRRGLAHHARPPLFRPQTRPFRARSRRLVKLVRPGA